MKLSAPTRRILVGVATVVALGAIALRASVFRDQVGWEIAFWAVQGVAMGVTWVLWGTFRRPQPERRVDMKARRLHW